MNDAAKARPPLNRRGIILMLATISALGSLAIHMMVPALPLVSTDLGITTSAAQQVVSFYLFGLAAGQLLVGPMVDRLGRKPVLLGGLAIYAGAAALGALAGDSLPLLAARVFQAMGASAGLVTSRVIVGDLFDRAEAGRRQATLMSVVLLSPAIAPLLGGLIAGMAGWRPIMGLLAGIGAMVLLASARFMPESLPRSGARAPGSLLQSYAALVRNRRFLRAAAAIAAASSALYMFLAIAPFLLIDRWGLSSEQAGFCFLAPAVAGICGTLVVGRIEKRRRNVLTVGLACSAIGAIIAFGLALSGVEGTAALIGPIVIMMAGAGITAPAGIAVIIHAEEGLAGTAASLSGAVQMAASGSAATLLGLIGPPSFMLLSAGMLGVSLFALAVAPRS